METISCEIKLKVGNKLISPKEIIDYVTKLEKYEIDYGDSLEYNEDKDGIKVSYTIDTNNKIDSAIKGGGIYFIISYEQDKLLYIGKSKDLKSRLRQHLIKCALSTGSHISDLIKYLKERKNQGKVLAVKYCIINTAVNINNAAIEGALIDYVINNKSDSFFDKCWNSRLD